MALGQVLKEARESKDLTVSEVAVITRMTSQIVSEIEKEDFHRFTAGLYWRSYIKLYAETMNVDPEPMLEEFMVLFDGKGKPKPAEQKPTPVKKRDFNIFPTGETALEKIERKKFSDNLVGCKEKMESLNKKTAPALKKASSKAAATSKQLAEKLSEGVKKLSGVKPLYLYSALGVVVGIIVITMSILSLKSYINNNKKTINEVVVSDVRAGIKVPEPYFDN